VETLRIAQVAPYFHPHMGGVESHVASVAHELARRGHDVEVVTTRMPGFAPAEERDGYHVTRVPQWANLFLTPITPGLGRALARARPDVVHGHSPPPVTSWFAARASRRLGIPYVLTYHCDLEIPVPGGGAIVEVYRRTLGHATVRAADAIVATTRTYAQTSRSLWSRSDVDVVPNAVDAREFTPEGPRDFVRERHGLGARPVALFVGRLTHHKGIEEFIRSAESTGDDVVHLVVGEGPRRHALERLARHVAPDRVVFSGRVAIEDLPAYYRAATVGVLPSTSRLEAFGIAALECMASGTPVVVSRIPGVEEVIEDGVTGALAEPLHPEDLGEKVRAICDDPERARSMGKAARERVLERFTIERVADRLLDVYARVLRR
jgi:glycosyltransferase involved in cell wall biosynthesis